METTWITLLKEIMQTVVVPLMGILTVFLIKVIREKMDAAAKDTNSIRSNFVIFSSASKISRLWEAGSIR